MIYDTIIIGKGPAGISASLYVVRAGFSVLVLGMGHGSLEKADKIDNYYGFPEPISGLELVDRGTTQAIRLGVEIRQEEVVEIGLEETYLVKTGNGNYQGKTLLLATGKSRFRLKLPGFEAFRGKGISFCATCDGFFYRKKRLAVIGNGDYAANELHELRAFTDDITLFTNGLSITTSQFPSDVTVIPEKIVSFNGDEKLSGISTADGIVHSFDGVFVALGTAGAADFAAKIGVEVNGSDIVVDHDFMTNMSGLFAAGDCVGGFLQIAKAVSDGALAAKAMIGYIKAMRA